jgi:hypothetical protein
MSTTINAEQIEVAVRQPAPPNLRTLDSLVKYIAVFSLLLCCCGYFVCSVSSLTYGFYEVAPFRPRVAAAGAWFILFLAIPLAALEFAVRSYFEAKAKPGKTPDAPSAIQFYAILGLGFGLGTYSLFEFTVPTMLRWMIPFLLFACFLSIGFVPGKVLRWVICIGSISIVAGSGFLDLIHDQITVSATFLWFLLIGLAWNFLVNSSSARKNLLEHVSRSLPFAVSLLLMAISYFGRSYYPHIKPSWGGGAPVPVTILFAKESAVLPGQYLSTQLLDESDAGVYIVGKGEKMASFIPKTEIASITYSDSPSTALQSKPK